MDLRERRKVYSLEHSARFEQAIRAATASATESVWELLSLGGAFTPDGNILFVCNGKYKFSPETIERLKAEHIIKIEHVSDFSNATRIYTEGELRKPLLHVYLVGPDFKPNLASLKTKRDTTLPATDHGLHGRPKPNPVSVLEKFIGELIQQKVGTGGKRVPVPRKEIESRKILEHIINACVLEAAQPPQLSIRPPRR